MARREEDDVIMLTADEAAAAERAMLLKPPTEEELAAKEARRAERKAERAKKAQASGWLAEHEAETERIKKQKVQEEPVEELKPVFVDISFFKSPAPVKKPVRVLTEEELHVGYEALIDFQLEGSIMDEPDQVVDTAMERQLEAAKALVNMFESIPRAPRSEPAPCPVASVLEIQDLLKVSETRIAEPAQPAKEATGGIEQEAPELGSVPPSSGVSDADGEKPAAEDDSAGGLSPPSGDSGQVMVRTITEVPDSQPEVTGLDSNKESRSPSASSPPPLDESMKAGPESDSYVPNSQESQAMEEVRPEPPAPAPSAVPIPAVSTGLDIAQYLREWKAKKTDADFGEETPVEPHVVEADEEDMRLANLSPDKKLILKEIAYRWYDLSFFNKKTFKAENLQWKAELTPVTNLTSLHVQSQKIQGAISSFNDYKKGNNDHPVVLYITSVLAKANNGLFAVYLWEQDDKSKKLQLAIPEISNKKSKLVMDVLIVRDEAHEEYTYILLERTTA
jgi:hypothetical protein